MAADAGATRPPPAASALRGDAAGTGVAGAGELKKLLLVDMATAAVQLGRRQKADGQRVQQQCSGSGNSAERRNTAIAHARLYSDGSGRSSNAAANGSQGRQANSIEFDRSDAVHHLAASSRLSLLRVDIAAESWTLRCDHCPVRCPTVPLTIDSR